MKRNLTKFGPLIFVLCVLLFYLFIRRELKEYMAERAQQEESERTKQLEGSATEGGLVYP